jgi:hypothetical protein
MMEKSRNKRKEQENAGSTIIIIEVCLLVSFYFLVKLFDFRLKCVLSVASVVQKLAIYRLVQS